MENLSLPSTITVKPEGENRATVSIEPCYPGYGTTIGNALRRVLLSSIPGAAITSVNIKGVSHEFTTIPKIKEDIVEIILRMKQIRLRLHTDEKVALKMNIKGEKKVTAKSIEATSDVEIANPELYLFSMTEKDATFEAELIAEPGRGYIPVENREKTGEEDVNAILIDAVYTPVRNVNFTVEHVRVGQMTNYDKLNLDIATDGTITPIEAYQKATKILLDHYMFLQSESEKLQIEKPAKKKSAEKAKEKEE